MKAIKPFLFLCAAICCFASCKKEVDMNLVQKTVFENADIRQIKVGDAWEVNVIADSNTYVELEYSAYLETYTKTKMEGTKLELGFTGNVHPVINSVYRATVHTNKIERIEAEDAAQLTFAGHFSATSDTLTIELDDASLCSGLRIDGKYNSISIDNNSKFIDFQINATNNEVSVKNASSCKGNFETRFHFVADLSTDSQLVTFNGSAPFGMIQLQDNCILNMAQTEIEEMQVNLSGASEATVNVTEQLSGSLTEASTLYYQGHPQIDVDCSDNSQLIPF